MEPPPDLVDYALTLQPGVSVPPTTTFYAGARAAEMGWWDPVTDAVDRLWSDAEFRRSQGDWEGERMSAAAASALDAYVRSFSGVTDELRARLVSEAARMTGLTSSQQVSATVRWWIADMAQVSGDRAEEERALVSLWNDPFASLRLARLYAGQGREEEARARARDALGAWTGADAKLGPLVSEARSIAGETR